MFFKNHKILNKIIFIESKYSRIVGILNYECYETNLQQNFNVDNRSRGKKFFWVKSERESPQKGNTVYFPFKLYFDEFINFINSPTKYVVS